MKYNPAKENYREVIGYLQKFQAYPIFHIRNCMAAVSPTDRLI
jgi:hypothetical protein